MPAWVLAFSLIPALIGAVFLAVGHGQRAQSRGWFSAPGVVVPAPPDRGTASWRFFWFAFRDHRGLEHVVADRGGSSPFLPVPGRAVPVIYDPDAPSRARVGTAGGTGMVLVVVGWVLVAIAVMAAVALVSVYWALR